MVTIDPVNERERIKREYGWDEESGFPPGKFEREPVYAPYFWELALEGYSDNLDTSAELIAIDERDRAVFPELGADAQFVVVFQDDSGFVYVNVLDHDPR